MSELYRPSDCRLSAKLVPTFADRRGRMVSVTDPYGRIPSFFGSRGDMLPKNVHWNWTTVHGMHVFSFLSQVKRFYHKTTEQTSN
jgi:hypothetical protein